MGFLRWGQGPAGRGRRATALVLEAVAPPEGGPTIGPGSHGAIRVLVDGRTLEAKVRMTEEHWLVPGQEVSAAVTGDRLEIDWDQVPSMQARAAANDPDPGRSDRRPAQSGTGARPDLGRYRQCPDRALSAPRSSSGPRSRHRRDGCGRWRCWPRSAGGAGSSATPAMIRPTTCSPMSARARPCCPCTSLGRTPYALYRPRFKCEVDLLEPLVDAAPRAGLQHRRRRRRDPMERGTRPSDPADGPGRSLACSPAGPAWPG